MSQESNGSKTIFRIIAYVSFAIILAVVWYAALSSLTQKLSDVGTNLVNVEFPPPSIFPLYLKPITWLYIGALTFMYSEYELNKEQIRRLSPTARGLCKFLGFLVAVVFFYEICYNFVLWGGEIGAAVVFGNLNPDLLFNKFPNLKEPWNLVFATKLWSVLFIAGLYTFWFFNKIEDHPNLNAPETPKPQPTTDTPSA